MPSYPLFKTLSKKIGGCCIVCILIFMTFSPILESTTITDEQGFKSDFLTNKSNSFYSAGVQAGQDYYPMYQLLQKYSQFGTNDKVTDGEITSDLIMLQEQYPFFYDELLGLSSSTHLSVHQLLAIQRFLQVSLGGACTTTLSTGPATKENQTYLTQNFDMGGDFNHYPLVTIFTTKIFLRNLHFNKINTLRYRYAYWGIPVLYEVYVLNEQGLGFGGNGLRLTTNMSRVIDSGSGMAIYELERLTMMTCQNVTEVAQLWKTTERASGSHGLTYPNFWDNSITMWCDKYGGILSIEQMHDYIVCVFGNMTEITKTKPGILWHANNHQWLDPNLTGSVTPDEGFLWQQTYLRAARARQLLEDNYGNITLDVCINITRDHGGGTNPKGKDSCDICSHTDANCRAQTLFSWIIDAKHFTVYWAPGGSPCKHTLQNQNLTNIFKT